MLFSNDLKKIYRAKLAKSAKKRIFLFLRNFAPFALFARTILFCTQSELRPESSNIFDYSSTGAEERPTAALNFPPAIDRRSDLYSSGVGIWNRWTSKT